MGRLLVRFAGRGVDSGPMMRVRFAAMALVAVLAAACGPGTGAGARDARARSGAELKVPRLSDERIGEAVATLLAEPAPTPDRTGLLVAVVRRQLRVSGAHFERGQDEQGLTTLNGAFNLVRPGEFHQAMFDGATPALRGAAVAVARVGNEGAATALYGLLKSKLPQGRERSDAESHLVALRDWTERTRSSAPVQAAGGDQRVALSRFLYEPTEQALRRARAATVAWIQRAMTYSREQLPPASLERDEAVEAYRAVRTGALTLAALYLRQGDAVGALQALEEGEVARVVSPNLHEALRRAAEEGDPEAWFELFHTFDSFASDRAGDLPFDRDVAQAAAWGASVELYRAEPNTMRGIMPVATWLLRHWMPEAALVLLAPVTKGDVDPRALSWVLTYALQAIVNAESAEDLQAARRLYARSARFLQAAQAPKVIRQVTPSAARVEYIMGAIEARAGEPGRARRHLEASVAREPTIESLRLLAAIDRQRGAAVEALKSLEAVAALAAQATDPTALAETHLAIFEVQRDLGNVKAAEKALDTALRRVLDARQLARTSPERAGAERVLARILELYGEREAARRAFERAYEASQSDMRQLTVTVLEASRRALTREDLNAAREAARRALEANLADEDVVYVALWLKLLEGRLKVPSDGTAEEAFAAVDKETGWPATLRAWGRGRINDNELQQAARGPVERTEAMFYMAMARRGQKDDRAVIDQLRKVAQSEAIQLVEVTIARDLIAGAQAAVKVTLPADVRVP